MVTIQEKTVNITAKLQHLNVIETIIQTHSLIYTCSCTYKHTHLQQCYLYNRLLTICNCCQVPAVYFILQYINVFTYGK